jgi:hypothetical protein
VTIKPTARPNPVRLAILGGLISTDKRTTRTHKVWDGSDNDVVSTTVGIVAAPVGLASNVSARNIEILARRWNA